MAATLKALATFQCLPDLGTSSWGCVQVGRGAGACRNRAEEGNPNCSTGVTKTHTHQHSSSSLLRRCEADGTCGGTSPASSTALSKRTGGGGVVPGAWPEQGFSPADAALLPEEGLRITRKGRTWLSFSLALPPPQNIDPHVWVMHGVLESCTLSTCLLPGTPDPALLLINPRVI